LHPANKRKLKINGIKSLISSIYLYSKFKNILLKNTVVIKKNSKGSTNA